MPTPAPEHRPVDRRKFLRAAATGAAWTLPASSYAAIVGSNDRLRVGVLGCGARGQAHLHLLTQMPDVTTVAVCDVWDGVVEEYEQTFGGSTTRRRFAQGLYPAAAKAGLDSTDPVAVTKDYRRVLDRADVDVVCVATPDHWHARMTLDALAAGKDVFCETPLTRTSAEAVAVLDALTRHSRVLTAGAQMLADPVWRAARDVIRTGRIGPIAHLSTGVFRNDIRGQWRFLRLVPEMTPKSVAWDLWLGHRFAVAGVPIGPSPAECLFDRATFAQWRCDARFSGGPFTDLLGHAVTRLLAAAGLRFPGRVSGSGGLYLEHDGRDVPDVATITADFDIGCHLVVTGSTLTAYPLEEVIRGRHGAVKFVRGGFQVIRDDPCGRSGLPSRLDRPLEPTEVVTVESPRNESEAFWRDFLDCVRRRDRATLCPPDLGAAAAVVVSLAQQGYRDGCAYGWDHEQRVAVPADVAWAKRWNQRSQHGGSSAELQPPSSQRFAGPWRGGEDPAAE